MVQHVSISRGYDFFRWCNIVRIAQIVATVIQIILIYAESGTLSYFFFFFYVSMVGMHCFHVSRRCMKPTRIWRTVLLIPIFSLCVLALTSVLYITLSHLYEPKWNLFEKGFPAHLHCKNLASGNKTDLEEYLKIGRVVLGKEPDLPMDCQSITNRINNNSHTQHPTDVPFAIARNVYTDYFVVETIFGMGYSPRNSYCYAMDSKSSDKFKRKIRTMAKCFENIQVLDEEFSFNSKGHFQDHAHFRCTQELLKKVNWTYILYAQNHDVPIRTNSEISQIIQLINGSQIHGYDKPRLDRYDRNRNWNARDLNLFKNIEKHNITQLDTPIKIFKTPNQVFLSRDFVAALDSELNMTPIMDAFNVKKYYGTDETLFATLGLAVHLGLPGRATPLCTSSNDVMRFVDWCSYGFLTKSCLTNHVRHTICIATVEYLPVILEHPGIIANKVLPEVDYGTIMCMTQELQARSKKVAVSKNIQRYNEYSMVRERQLRANGTFDEKAFKC